MIMHELRSRPIFIVILSPAAFASSWVTQECQWAWNLYQRKPERVILPVTAHPINPDDFDAWLFMEDFKRIERVGGIPYPALEAIENTLHALDLGVDTHTVIPAMARTQTLKSLLWVDDIPSNNFYERRYLERRGFEITLSLSTDDALGKLIRNEYGAIISDMGRPDDPMAGYTLLEWAQKLGKRMPPYLLYTSSRQTQHVAEARRRGAFGQTNTPEDLLELIRQAIGEI
jgi:CheY-like chemotaxis protein